MIEPESKGSKIFWGCIYTHTLPYLIKTTERVLDDLEIDSKGVSEWSCCPDPNFIKAYNENLHLTLAARNLSLGSKEAGELVVACNGCYKTLKDASLELKHPKTKAKVNDTLPDDLQYDGIPVSHLVEKLHKKVSEIKEKVKKPLNIKVAVHYGCHALNPLADPTDDPENPKSLDNIVAALGAESMCYETKLDCCGVPAAGFNTDESDRLLQKKLAEAREKADCIVVSCPACFVQFDRLKANMKDFSVPVMHINELIALSFGYSPEELHLDRHATKVDQLLEKIGLKSRVDEVRKHFSLDLLNNHCKACSKECNAAVVTKDTEIEFDPLATVDKLLEGKLDEVLEGNDIWMCLQCGSCEIRCPNNIGLKDMFNKLRELALERGIEQKAVAEKVRMLEKTGYGTQPRETLRKKLGMESAPKANIKGIKEVMEKLGKKR